MNFLHPLSPIYQLPKTEMNGELEPTQPKSPISYTPLLWAIALGTLAYALFKEKPSEEDKEKYINKEENPRSPEFYAQMFKIFTELRSSRMEHFGQYAMDSTEKWIANPVDAAKGIIEWYRKTDRIETYLHMERYAQLTRYFRNISRGPIMRFVDDVIAETQREQRETGIIEKDIAPGDIEEKLNELNKIITEPVLAKAFSIWKGFYLKSTIAPTQEINYSIPIINGTLPDDPRAQYILKKFPKGSWQLQLLVEILEGFQIFVQQYERMETYGGRLDHYNTMIINNRNFYALANDIVWNMYDIPRTLENLRQAERQLEEMKQVGKQIEEGTEHIFIDMGDWKWVVADPEEESRMMAHCGREREGAILLSLRHYDKKKKMIIAHVTAAFYMVQEYSDDKSKAWGFITQMKGRGNNKPIEKYHPYIIALFKDPRIQAKLPGQYRPENDFQLDDLAPKERDALYNEKKQLFSLIDFKNALGGPKTLQLLKATGVELGEDARIAGDIIIIKTWDDEHGFIKDIGTFTDRETREAIKHAWDWVEEPKDLGYTPTYSDSKQSIDDLFDGLEKKHPEDYKKLEAYLSGLYPEEAPRDALDSLFTDDDSHPLIDAFKNAIYAGEEAGFTSEAHDEFLRSLEEITWYSGVYIWVEHKPFKIALGLDMPHFDKLLKGELEIDSPENLFSEIERGFKMRDVSGSYDEDYALSDLVEMRLPDAYVEIEKNMSKEQKKIFRDEMAKLGAKPINVEEEENPTVWRTIRNRSFPAEGGQEPKSFFYDLRAKAKCLWLFGYSIKQIVELLKLGSYGGSYQWFIKQDWYYEERDKGRSRNALLPMPSKHKSNQLRKFELNKEEIDYIIDFRISSDDIRCPKLPKELKNIFPKNILKNIKSENPMGREHGKEFTAASYLGNSRSHPLAKMLNERKNRRASNRDGSRARKAGSRLKRGKNGRFTK